MTHPLKALLLLWLTTTAHAAPPLRVLTWSEYFSGEVASQFERQCDCQLQFILYDSEEQRDHLLVNSAFGGIDLVLLDSVKAKQYRKLGWLLPLSRSSASQAGIIAKHFYRQHPELLEYTQPYFWGTMGILYRRDRVNQPPQHWRDLFTGDASLRSKIIMPSSPAELFALAHLANGVAITSEHPASIMAAVKLLDRQRPNVLFYGYPPLNESSPLIEGQAAIWATYNGDAQTLMALHPQLEYVQPEEGAPMWMDMWAIPVGGNQPLAERFLAFLRQPAIEAKLAAYLNYPPLRPAAAALLPEDFQQRTAIHLSEAQQHKLQPFVEYSNQTTRLVYSTITNLIYTP